MKHGPQEAFSRLETIGQNDVYTWVLGYQKDGSQGGAHSKLTLICPAGNGVVEKYSAHERRMIIETPQLYEKVTEPWIESIPRSKTQWVRNILDGVSESESVLYRDDDPKSGFVLTPDLKWDQRTLSSLYLVAIVKDESLTNLRDLTKEQIPLLKKIKAAAAKVATEKYGLSAPSEDGIESSLRCYIHYMPTFLYVFATYDLATFMCTSCRSTSSRIPGPLSDRPSYLRMSLAFSRQAWTSRSAR